MIRRLKICYQEYTWLIWCIVLRPHLRVLLVRDKPCPGPSLHSLDNYIHEPCVDRHSINLSTSRLFVITRSRADGFEQYLGFRHRCQSCRGLYLLNQSLKSLGMYKRFHYVFVTWLFRLLCGAFTPSNHTSAHTHLPFFLVSYRFISPWAQSEKLAIVSSLLPLELAFGSDTIAQRTFQLSQLTLSNTALLWALSSTVSKSKMHWTFTRDHGPHLPKKPPIVKIGP